MNNGVLRATTHSNAASNVPSISKWCDGHQIKKSNAGVRWDKVDNFRCYVLTIGKNNPFTGSTSGPWVCIKIILSCYEWSSGTFAPWRPGVDTLDVSKALLTATLLPGDSIYVSGEIDKAQQISVKYCNRRSPKKPTLKVRLRIHNSTVIVNLQALNICATQDVGWWMPTSTKYQIQRISVDSDL